jgi:hypothetical protein
MKCWALYVKGGLITVSRRGLHCSLVVVLFFFFSLFSSSSSSSSDGRTFASVDFSRLTPFFDLPL